MTEQGTTQGSKTEAGKLREFDRIWHENGRTPITVCYVSEVGDRLCLGPQWVVLNGKPIHIQPKLTGKGNELTLFFGSLTADEQALVEELLKPLVP